MKKIIGIDVGGSTTKIVAFSSGALLSPEIVKATDPVTSLYGAFGKFTTENKIDLSGISRIIATGVGSSHVGDSVFGLRMEKANEFDCVGRGGLFISGLEKAIIISCGTGTAVVSAENGGDGVRTEYLGGTGVGGGTLIGLSKKLLGIETTSHLEALAEGGSLENVDLTVKDLSRDDSIFTLKQSMTASNFGRVSDIASDSDIALGIINMVFETIGMIGVFAARNVGIKDIVLTGNLAKIKQAKSVFEKMSELFGFNFIIPENAQFSTAIGAALS